MRLVVQVPPLHRAVMLPKEHVGLERIGMAVGEDSVVSAGVPSVLQPPPVVARPGYILVKLPRREPSV